MTTNIELAYIAGLLDGEAYIGIKKVNTKYNGRVNPAYQERIQVRMVDENAIKFLADTLGGSYYKESPSVAKGRSLYCYQASNKKATIILSELLPYLKVKHSVAETVLQLRKLKDAPDTVVVSVRCKNRWGQVRDVPRRRHSDAHIGRCETLYLECKKKNRVGIN